MKRLHIVPILFLMITVAPQALAAEKMLTIIHTNDMHSHVLGAPPNIEYTPSVTGDDETIGGWARIATVINDVKKNRQNTVLVLDAGDFLMGSTFLKIIGSFTWQILEIVPKDRNGNPIEDLKTVRVDADKHQPGIQELKEWKAVIDYIRQLPDTDGDGIANIPDKYKGKLGRNTIEASWNPYKLLKRGTYVTWTAFGILVLALLVMLMIGRFVVKRFAY